MEAGLNLLAHDTPNRILPMRAHDTPNKRGCWISAQAAVRARSGLRGGGRHFISTRRERPVGVSANGASALPSRRNEGMLVLWLE